MIENIRDIPRIIFRLPAERYRVAHRHIQNSPIYKREPLRGFTQKLHAENIRYSSYIPDWRDESIEEVDRPIVAEEDIQPYQFEPELSDGNSDDGREFATLDGDDDMDNSKHYFFKQANIRHNIN